MKSTTPKFTGNTIQSDSGINRTPKLEDIPKVNGDPESKADPSPASGPDDQATPEAQGSDLLLAQEDLRWSEKRYRKIFEHTKDGIIVLDAQQHIILDLNQSMADMFGHTRDELLSRPVTDIWPEKLNQVVDLAQKVIDGGQVSGMELACKTRNGRPLQVEITASIIDFDNWPSILCVVRDNTERKQAEEAMQALATTFASVSGTEFFTEVSRHLAETLDMDYAFIGELTEDKQSVSVLAGIGKGQVLDPFQYDLADTPCDDIMGESICCYPSGVQELYPKDALLAQMEIEGYIGAPLFYKAGQALGIMVLLDRAPIRNRTIAESLFQIFAERVATEIEREQLHRKLADSERMLTSIVTAIPDIIYRLDSEGKIIFVNDTVRRYGYEPEELLGADIFDLVHPEDLEIATNAINERRTGDRRTSDLEIRLFSKNHAPITFDVHDSIIGTPVFSVDAEGQYEQANSGTNIYRGTQGVARDITRRKRAEEALQKSEERFRSFFEHAPMYCYMVGPEGKIMDVNQAAMEALGYEKDELNGKPFKSLYAPESQEKAQQLLDEWLDTGELLNEELIIVTKTGEYRHILLSTSTVTDDLGRLLHSISIQKDITELKQAQEHMARTAKLSALGQFAAGIAHEVNNSLSAILLSMEAALYQDDNLSNNIRSALVTSKEAAIRAGKIVANILEFARERPMHRDLCNLHDLIDKVLNISSADVLSAKVTIQKKYMASAPQLELDTIQIQQVFMNVIINAIQAMPEGGSLMIRTLPVDDGRKIAVEFTDTGVGIPENTTAKIFDPFFTTKPDGVGTGLGLSISYGLVEAHGGEIKVHSKVGEGTTFTVLFPTDHSEAQNHPANPPKTIPLFKP